MQKITHQMNTLKNTLTSLPLLSTKTEIFSQSLKELMSFVQSSNSSLGLPNEGNERDLRSIVQKHDRGDPLSDNELGYLLGCVESALYRRSFLHLETLQILSAAFTSFVKSRCYAANPHTIHIFKKFNLLDVAFGEGKKREEKTGKEKKGIRNKGSERKGEEIVSLLSRGFYQCMEEVAEDFSDRLQAHPCPLNDPTLIEPLKAIVPCLGYFSYGGEGHILSPTAFRESLQPYLSDFIQMAKTCLVDDEGRLHPESSGVLEQEYKGEKILSLDAKAYRCIIFAEDVEKVLATIVFEKQSATLSLRFPAFDDFLGMAEYVSRFVTFKERENRGEKENKSSKAKGKVNTSPSDILSFNTQGLSFLWNPRKETVSGLLMTPNVSFMLNSEETRDLIAFLLEVNEKLKEPLTILREHFGRV